MAVVLKKLLKIAGWALLAFLVLFCVLFPTLIYVNDARVTLPNLSSENGRRLGLTQSILRSNIDYRLSGKPAARKKLAKEFQKEHKQNLISKSARFENQGQVYLAVGSYPAKLEGKDAFLLPAGESLTIAPRRSGKFVISTSFVGFGVHPQIEVRVNDKPSFQENLPPLSAPVDREGFFYRTFARYLFIDTPPTEGGSWKPFEQELELQPTDELQFECKNETGGCFVSDIALSELLGVRLSPQLNYGDSRTPNNSECPGSGCLANVVLVLVDTLRYDAVNETSMPYLAGLKKSSVSFENAIAPGNMTSPSTNSILACKMPSNISPVSFSYSLSEQLREAYYAKRQPSFPSVFAKAGYKTAMIGTVSILSEIMGAGVNHGFDEDIAVETEGYETPHLAREAMQWIERNHDRPFFLYLHFNAPHGPYKPPLSDLMAMFPGFFKAFASWGDIMKWQYRGEAHFTDRYLAQVMSALEKYKLTDNTVFVVSADHGDHFTPSSFTHNSIGPSYFGSFFDHGATLLNDEIHVPLIIKKPGAEPAAVQRYTSTIDIGPTLLKLADIKGGDWCEGKPLIPLRTKPDDIIGSEGFRERSIIFDQRYKYIRAYAPTEKRFFGPEDYVGRETQIFIEERLHDLQSDPLEARNVDLSERKLLHHARDLFREYYGVKTRTELVIESPKQADFKVKIFGEVEVAPHDSYVAKPDSDGIEISGSFSDRQVIPIGVKSLAKVEVTVNARPIPITFTSYRIPISLDEWRKTLPEMHSSLLDFNKTNVYLRKVEDDEVKKRKIVANQPEFEKILREWGYLHED